MWSKCHYGENRVEGNFLCVIVFNRVIDPCFITVTNAELWGFWCIFYALIICLFQVEGFGVFLIVK